MKKQTIEVKAACPDLDKIRKALRSLGAAFLGTDHQIDTYFRVPEERLKLREGDIENYLIYYEREDRPGPKSSLVELFKTGNDSGLKPLLSRALGVLVSVEKRREIYLAYNVKFHLDEVPGLGRFIEIEVLGDDETYNQKQFLGTCRRYMELFGIQKQDLVEGSYSDLLLRKKAQT